MPHNRNVGIEPNTDSEWGWLQDATLASSTRTTTHSTAVASDNEWNWLDTTTHDAHRPRGSTETLVAGRHFRRWPAAVVTVAVAAAVIVAAVRAPTTETTSTAVPPILTAPTSTPEATGTCRGLMAPTVTENNATPTSLAGVIAAFEYAYYRQRSAETAIILVAPESGLQRDSLAAGIATVPTGTRHCVAITPIADTAADVHLVEVRPDGTRTDYLQVINTRRSEAGLLITNIQKRG